MSDATKDSDPGLDAMIERLLATLRPALAEGGPAFAELTAAMLTSLRKSPVQLELILQDFYQGQIALWQRWLLPSQPAQDGLTTLPDLDTGVPPFFGFLQDQHLVWERWTEKFAATLDARDDRQRRLRFLIRQWSAAAAPGNFLATNAEALHAAVASRGSSLAQGLARLQADADLGRVTMSSVSDFTVGRDLGATAGAVVLENAVMQLIHYRPRAARVASRPLVMVPPFINKFYVLDLRPGRSLVEWALDQGWQVFMISWRNAGETMATATWDDFVRDGVLAAIDAALEITRGDGANVLGYCVGGTLAACAAGVDAAGPGKRISSLTLLATLLDYADPGDIGVYIDERSVREVEARFGAGGIVPAADVANAFASLRPRELIWEVVANNYLLGRQPVASELLYWNDDGTDVPGPLYAWYLRHLYLMNRLCRPRGVDVCGVPIALSTIRVPTYVFAARDDHIVPWASAFESMALLGGAHRFVLGENGHIGGVVNPPARNRHGYWTAEVGSANAADWLASAQHNRGSWWQDWSIWLKTHAGRMKAASARTGSRRHPPIEEAPGRYVLERAAVVRKATAGPGAAAATTRNQEGEAE